MKLATNISLPLFLFFTLAGFAQVDFINFSKGNGLTSNSILVTKVDSKGVLWVGTVNGVSAYTSTGWVQIKSISDNDRYNKFIGRVSIIFEASNGDIWICGEKGIFVFNGEYWTYFDDNENEGYLISDIFEDRRGWVWVMFEKYQSLKDVSVLGFSMVEGVLQMYNGERWHKFVGEIGGSAAIAIGDKKQYFTSHIQDNNGNLWVTSLDGLYKFDGFRWTEYDQEEIPSDICNKVIQNSSGDIWVATRNGVAFKKDSSWIEFKKQKGIKGLDAVEFYEDYLKRLWVLSRKDDRFKSICVYDGNKWKPFFREKLKIRGDVDEMITNDSLILIYSDKGISSYTSGKWINLLDENNIDYDNFGNFTRTWDGRLLFTGKHGLYEIKKSKIKTLYNSASGWKANSVVVLGDDILIGTDKTGIYQISNGEGTNYTTDNGLPDDNVKLMFTDTMNNIWVVTRAGISQMKIQN